jgi:hypothetical protein
MLAAGHVSLIWRAGLWIEGLFRGPVGANWLAAVQELALPLRSFTKGPPVSLLQ